jgi:hypothetical protein
MSRLLPLFPLRMVAFPGSAIPLHIFEERYREMVGEAEAEGTEFGILLAKEGGILNVGCSVTVEAVLERYGDGRFDVLTRGQRRFTVSSVNEDRAYLRGDVEFFDDLDWTPISSDLRDRVMLAWERIEGAERAQGKSMGDRPDPDSDRLSFEVAQRMDDVDFQTSVLRMRSEIERLRHFLGFVDAYVERIGYVAKMKQVAPMNGSGHKPAGM